MKKRKVLVVLGSPRKNGNSSALAKRTAEGAGSAGAECETIRLHEMHIKPCNACDYCLTKPGHSCILKDDMQKLYPKLVKADAIVMAGPVYWFTVSAQIKLFMDRWYALDRQERPCLEGQEDRHHSYLRRRRSLRCWCGERPSNLSRMPSGSSEPLSWGWSTAPETNPER